MAADDALSRPGRRLARGLAHALSVGALIAAAPAPAEAAGVLVRLAGVERHLSPEVITASVDRPAGTYLLRARGTAAVPVAHPPALSVRGLITLAGGSPDALSFVSIERPNGTAAVLRRGDLGDPPPFPEGPPLVWMDAGGARFQRPLRGPADANAADNIGVVGGDLVVRAHQGPLLTVRATAERRSVPAGAPVTLSATVEDRPAGASLTFAWRFGDGTGGAGQVVRHRFRAGGVYEAVVTVTGDDDSGGAAAPLRIRVGDPPQAGGGTGGGTGARRRAPATGPVRGGEQTQGSSAGDQRPSRSSTAAEPRRSSGTGRAPGSAAGGKPPRGSDRDERPRGSSAGDEAAPRSAAGDGPPPRPSRRRAADRRAPRSRRAPAPTAADRDRAPRVRARRSGRAAELPPRRVRNAPVVRGTLVAARVPAVLPPAVPLPAAGAAAAARRGSDPSAPPVATLAGLLAAAALVGLGVRRERRDLRLRGTA